TAPRNLEQLGAERGLWFRVLDQIESGAMPPKREKPLSAPDRLALVAWIRGDLTDLLVAKQLKEGRSKLRRLSRTEYANTIQDLFGIRPDVERNLPEDGRVDGYDKVGAALALSAEGSLGYFRMCDDLLSRWLLRPVSKFKNPASRTVRAAA